MNTIDDCQPGRRVRIRRRIDRRDRDWEQELVGTVRAVELDKTGSWYAHSKDDKYWLCRLHLQKDDGEISVLNIDNLTTIECLDGAGGD